MITRTKTQLSIEELRPRLVPVLKKHHVSKAAIFGSFVTGAARKMSDLDILVEFSGKRSLLDLVALKFDLEAEINRKVDVVTYRSLDPLIKAIVLQQEVRVL